MSFMDGTKRVHKMKSKMNNLPVKLVSTLPGIFTVVLIFFGPVNHGFAQNDELTGTWKHSQDSTEQARRYAAIDEATKGMNKLMRGRAREMLRAKTVPQPGLSLSDSGKSITFVSQDRRLTLTTDGSTARVQNERGTATLRAKRDDGKLVVTSQAQNGVQTTVYRVSKDRTRLVLDISVSGSRLAKPIRFQATYHRDSK